MAGFFIGYPLLFTEFVGGDLDEPGILGRRKAGVRVTEFGC